MEAKASQTVTREPHQEAATVRGTRQNIGGKIDSKHKAKDFGRFGPNKQVNFRTIQSNPDQATAFLISRDYSLTTELTCNSFHSSNRTTSRTFSV